MNTNKESANMNERERLISMKEILEDSVVEISNLLKDYDKLDKRAEKLLGLVTSIPKDKDEDKRFLNELTKKGVRVTSLIARIDGVHIEYYTDDFASNARQKIKNLIGDVELVTYYQGSLNTFASRYKRDDSIYHLSITQTIKKAKKLRGEL